MKPTVAEALNPSWWLARGWHFARVRLFSPTRRFAARRVHTLVFDVETKALSEVPFAAPLRALEPFGRANWYWSFGTSWALYYYDLGLVLAVSEDGFESFEVHFRPSEGLHAKAHGLRSATLELRIDAERRVRLSGASTERELLRLLGRPKEKQLLGGRSACSFEIGELRIDSYCRPESGELIALEVFAPAETSSGATTRPIGGR